MNKVELVAELASRTGDSKVAAGEYVDALISVISDTLARGEAIAIAGFGIFSVKDRKERIGRNPKTGENVTIPAAKAPKFSPGAKLKAAVNGAG